MPLARRLLLLAAMTLALTIPASAAPDEDPWSAIDARPNPAWWGEAKFGLFIHWGPYAVPAFSAQNEYAEWYWKALMDESVGHHAIVKSFHAANYGADFDYQDFAPDFTAQLFNPQDWADLFVRSGARYVVLTSKHHDGFALWPSADASRTWNRPWNAVEIGPQRDVLGDLAAATRDAGLKFGIYFSLYEWFNPLYQADPDRFVSEHMIPQFKDVVNRYHPSVIFADGEWEHPAALWHSTEMLDWLFHHSPSAADVVVNDRWGKETRHAHGGYFTTEYGSGMADATHPWEENRGMGHSYGYSRTENLADYTTGREFVLMLADIVSRGGNFLLNIGPTADGRIPVIMQQRLTEIGDWLSINGEAIYGTTPWKRSTQWSAGIIRDSERGQYKSGYDILKLTVAPDPGQAVKEVLFTRKGTDLFAICPVLPAATLRLRDVAAPATTVVTLLGNGTALSWQTDGDDLLIDMPAIDVSRDGGRAAYVFKLAGALTP
ncbi:alpha-L-fucosidase [Synoicihabitans lomoniglobus]|uniref:alpha-L-fucosidase n=1 Tax=Synoicihabitans lomoniglobus TaxID=2909285 RepID=A0AAF0CSL4_9BACT|nr:alpha-L-fucosidase [Opitutaceae bacterium LMO-M01]WED67285.1 alpha-L-fucosidase [Opitutaceae bacterium LMO-M01]